MPILLRRLRSHDQFRRNDRTHFYAFRHALGFKHANEPDDLFPIRAPHRGVLLRRHKVRVESGVRLKLVRWAATEGGN